MRLRWLALAIGAVSLAAGCGQYPDGDIDLIVPTAAGESTDLVARAVAPCLATQLGVDVTVRNRPGEDGVLGARALTEADFDGRTLLISSIEPIAVTPLLLPQPPPYVFDDFRFLGVVRSAPVVLFTAIDGAVGSAEELLAAAKAGGPPITVANHGDLTVEGFTLSHLNLLAKTRLVSAPVDSDAEILRAVVAGDHTAGLTTLTPELLSRITSGEVRLLASGGHERPEYLPWVPTIYELVGQKYSEELPDLVIDTMVTAPKFIVDELSSTLSDALSECLGTEDVRRGIGAEFVPADHTDLNTHLDRMWDLHIAVLSVVDPG